MSSNNHLTQYSANVVFNDRRQNRGRHPGGSHSSSQIGPVKELMACFRRELRSGAVRLGVERSGVVRSGAVRYGWVRYG